MSLSTKEFTKSSPEIKFLCKRDKALSHVIDYIGNLKYRLYGDAFTHFVFTIIGQMLSNKVADVLCDRMVTLCGGKVSPATVSKFSAAEIKGIGVSLSKAENILGLAKLVINDPRYFQRLKRMPDEEIKKELIKIRGIGIWSVNMYLIFVLDRPDILPTEDVAFAQAVEWVYGISDRTTGQKHMKACLKHWSPYSSIAARYMYRLLDSGITKQDDSPLKKKLQKLVFKKTQSTSRRKHD